jgi:2,3-dihydroxybenzoate decarboxylase
MVVGHLGEGLPYWFFRLDFMHNRIVGSNRYPAVRKLTKNISDYLRENFFVTTSGMSWAPPILYARSVLGIDRIMFAMDYPYQFVAEEARVIDNLPISEADKSKLYHTNAERIFRL